MHFGHVLWQSIAIKQINTHYMKPKEHARFLVTMS